VGTTSAEFGLHAGNMTFNPQNPEWISTRITGCIIVRVYLSVHFNLLAPELFFKL